MDTVSVRKNKKLLCMEVVIHKAAPRNLAKVVDRKSPTLFIMAGKLTLPFGGVYQIPTGR